MEFTPRIFKNIFVYTIAAGCLLWVMHGVRLDELFNRIRVLVIWWVIPALMVDVLSTAMHGVRWQLLLRPCGSVPRLRTTQAVYAGLFANEILPMRAGELLRGFLVSRWMGVPLTAVLPSMITERVVDGSVLVLALGLAIYSLPVPAEITGAGITIGIMLLLVIGVLVTLTLTLGKQAAALPTAEAPGRTWLRRLRLLLSGFSEGLRSVWTSRYLLPALVVSLLFLSLQAVSFWMVMRAYGLQVSPWAPAVVLIMVRLGTAIPNAPANIGPYQFFCVLGLTLFGIEKTLATGFAIVLTLVFKIPLLTLGALAFVRSGMTVSRLRSGLTDSASGTRPRQ